jgi:hypothetical protein
MKEKTNPSQLSDFVNQTNGPSSSSSEKRQKLNDETSQNSSQSGSLTNLSQFVELNKEERTSSPSLNQNQLITDNRLASKYYYSISFLHKIFEYLRNNFLQMEYKCLF